MSPLTTQSRNRSSQAATLEGELTKPEIRGVIGWCSWANVFALLFMVVSLPLVSRAQSFSAPVEYAAGNAPYGAAVGDFNGDGKMDVAVANNTSKTVSVLLGNGGSSFNSKTDYPVGAGPYSIVTVDLNNDGKLDLVSANSFSLTPNLSVWLGNGDGTFQSKVDYASVGIEPRSLRVADLNADGKPDLVCNGNNGAVVFIGNGDGTLKPFVSYTADATSYSVAVGDFNQDNKPDLAVSSYGNASGRVSILLGIGDGTFQPAVHMSAGPSPFSIAAADFNGDGKVDLVTSNIQVGTVGVLIGNGDGTFQGSVSYSLPTNFPSYVITTADLNGDGKMDVLVAGNGFSFCVLKGNGNGTLQSPINFTTGGVFATIADLNFDGKPDLISRMPSGTIGVFINSTGPYSLSGTIKDSNGAALNNVSVFLAGAAAEQTNTDATGHYAFSDLASGGNYTVQPLRQNYVFAPPTQTANNLSSNVVADFTATLLTYSITGTIRDNFNNRMANVTVTLTGGQSASTATLADGTYSFINVPGGGTYTLTPAYPKFVFTLPSVTVTNLSNNQFVNFSGSLPTFTISGSIKDAVNGTDISQLPVLLTGTRSASTITSSGYSFSSLPVDGNYTISAFAANGNALFTNFLLNAPSTQTVNGLSANITVNFSATRLNSSVNGLNPAGIAQGDLNGDGKPDLIVAITTGGSIRVLIGNGDGTFNPSVAYANPSNTFDVTVGDFDRDGKLDVASISAGVNVFLGNGDGTLKARVDYAVPGSLGGTVRAADVNLDGKLDLVVLSSGNNLSILLGNGDGTFAAAKTKNYPYATGSVIVGDFNADNKPDLVTEFFPGGVYFFAGNGDGTFADPVSSPAGSEVREASAGDLNGDGKLDLVVGNFRGFTVLLGNGNGTFQAPVTTSIISELLGSVLRDFDGDGKVDLAIVNASSGIMFAPGNGDGTFGPLVFYGPGSYTVAVVSADFNGDGKPDLACTNGNVGVLLNTALTGLPSVQFSAASVNVDEAAGNAVLTVTRTTGVSGAAKVNFATGDLAGTQSCATVNQKASSRCDYTAMIGSIDFAPGELSKTISIPLVDDGFVEGNESFTVSLTGASGASLATPTQITVNIIDNDVAPPANPVDQPPFFVSENYRDFLNRQPDADGLAFWSGQINSCGADPNCVEVKRINVSAAFFLSIEFQQTGYLVERFYKTAFGDASGTSTFGGTHQLPVPVVRFNEFLQDTQRIGRGIIVLAPGWEQLLESNKQAYASEFVQTPRFLTTVPVTLSPAQFVDKLNANAGNVLSASERTAAINLFGGTSDTNNLTARAQVVRQIAEDADLYNAEFNRAFVLTQFFGYLRRNPNDAPDADYTGYDFWLTKLNQFNGDYIAAEMVKAFISSSEYRQRFGP